jgi:hypothetical protein
VVLFDVQQRTSVADLSTPFIKYVVWSADMNHVALLSKHAIIIANRRLGQASTGVTLVFICCLVAPLTATLMSTRFVVARAACTS